ncbi:hypothetical protein ABB37_03568 [Leptomonas pyrrhocoris]|uniref:HECT domain-containing protein n=1 Tax=Leptomonas pyrrhocoris TaxID=157538 RepID=A0A0M9G5E9_LEPPY|nr:hypothetical protein ABB37_03568 [Leptomonas pyrrhocoris]XP_015660959.1 hypothetical protein ABB37_03568 [Leptomonas pyrrhocoris]KPA82519.1 hypothetical protein ABB37_03568 [Leptomonas pyrrhocoris]KPA82520.1 hypothetical protein ABB37_03568 [Leptomonas pyrrhocoris]|eukprot:XP_015660958.1 hypothetical protein ABB37_03568 [Leptomonas pyrrhocoris]
MSSPVVRASANVEDEDAYTSLLGICTELIISEGTDDPPIHDALGVLHGLLHCEHLSGDATVLSVRAVRILVDKFIPTLKSKSRAKLVECVRAALRRMKTVAGDAARGAFTFVHTKLWELQEELLQCMSTAAQSDDIVRAALPPPEEQLRFCVYVMDTSLDMCLQALRMCCVLLRSGSTNYPGSPVSARIRRVLREKLAALESMEVNQDWLRLLRHLTEGFVTIKAYVTGTSSNASPLAKSAPTSMKNSKRERSASVTAANFAAGDADGAALKGDEVLTWLRLCQKVCATPRLDRGFRSTVFGCASTVLSTEPALNAVPATTCVALIVDLARELSRNVRTTLTITNPFINRENVSGAPATSSNAGPNPFGDLDGENDEDEDQGEDLLNNGEGVKWHTPEPEWPLLVLISVLLSSATMASAEYMWWWVGDDEYARRFAKDDRAQLTRAFFAAGDAVKLRKRGSRVSLSAMREIQWPFANSYRIVFQPIPCAYDVTTCAAPSLQALPPRRAQEQVAALRKCDLKNLFEHLSAATRHEGPIAQYGQTVLLTLLLAVGPDSTDVTRSALRSFLADASTALIERVSESLLGHDRAWAGTLVEVGVAETILRRSTAVTPERSPVVRMLRREAASLPVTPPLLPQRSNSPADPAQLKRIFQYGGREELRELLTSLTDGDSPWNTTPCLEAATSLAAAAASARTAGSNTSAAWVAQVENTIASVVLKHLQDIALQFQSAKSLKETVEDAEVVQLELCSAGLSPAFCCPQQHPLHHHHSTNWTCDTCAAKGLDNAWSCRLCNYDLCAKCARTRCNRVEGAVTATALDVLVKVRSELHQPPQQQQQKQQPAAGRAPSENLLEFFTDDGGFVSAATPLACLHQRPLHVAELCKLCACGFVCPQPVRSSLATVAPADNATTDLLGVLLRSFGASCGQDVGVQRSLLKAYEDAGMRVFLGGARAVPPSLRRVMRGLAPHLPLAVKHTVARYLAVDCRRYAFQVLHDESAAVLSMVTGVTAESTRNHRIQVPRGDKTAMIRILHDGFRALLSPVLRVDFIFEGEEGFGSGPSQELYTELSAYFRAERKFWFVTNDDGGADPIVLPFPSATALFLQEFFVLGAACARSFVDDFRMNLDLLPECWNLLRIPSLGVLLEGHQHRTVGTTVHEGLEKLLEVLDPSLHRTFTQLRTTSETQLAAMELEMDDGTPITTHAGLNAHIEHTILTRYEIALENLRQFQWGLLYVLELPSLDCLSNSELSAVLCGADREGEGPLFTEDELRTQTTVGNGYSSDSPHVEMFISIVGSELTRSQQHDFLEFLTGTPRLPLNGLAGLGRLITVAMKDMEGAKELTLPSCNTCFLYLKLPPYTTRDIMKARLLLAVTEGRRNYSLS